uniref:N-acetylmuramoyl-L-alanine amidase n=1 Tax=Nonomuraea sp. CA-251285 TaxID=3240002 RepID=UPI003F4950AC
MVEPRVTAQAARYSGGSNLPIQRIVIHATCGGRGFPRESAKGVAAATAAYFRSANAGGSAHYVCDIADEMHTLSDAVIAWHAPPNMRSIGIEVCADGGERYGKFVPYTREQWLSAQVWPAVKRAAWRTRELCQRHKIPMTRLTAAQVRNGARGICGHVDVSRAFGQSDHTDPGDSFPWDHFMAAVLNTATDTEDDMPVIVSLGLGKAQEVPKGSDVALAWRTEFSDKEGLHAKDGAALLADDTYWCLPAAMVELTGLQPGAQVSLVWTRLSRDGKTVKDEAWTVMSPPADAKGRTVAEVGGQFQLNKDVQLRLRVLNPLAYPIRVEVGSMAKFTLFAR